MVSEGGSPHLGDRQPSGGDHQRVTGEIPLWAIEGKAAVVPRSDLADIGIAAQYHAPLFAFVYQRVSDRFGPLIAEHLPGGFFVPGEAVGFQQRQNIPGGEAGQGAFYEVGVGAQEVFWRGFQMGNVAAATAGDEDFFTGFGGFL